MIIIKKDCISIQKSNNEILHQKLFLYDWLRAYLLQKLCDKLINDGDLQTNIEDYVFEINNAESIEDIVLPDALENILACLDEAILKNDSFDIEINTNEVHIDNSEFIETINDIINEFLLGDLDDVNDQNVNLQVDDAYGKVFLSCLITRLTELGYIIEIQETDNKKKECQIFYNAELLFESTKELHNCKIIEIVDSIGEGIPVQIRYVGNGECIYRYLYFPFWEAGDKIEISVAMREGRTLLQGQHKKSRIISLFEI